mmetsp:Transcript_20882/g.26352  ORF Transcript_20882/g.26352 Transcript_20882/m.26352 type:complete len:136 (+) Transcript_20882:133-540(+)
MGSNQSSPEKIKSTPDPSLIQANVDNASATADKNTAEPEKKKKAPPPKNLTGFALVEYKCRKKRTRYDRCYRQKHSAFVVGSQITLDSGEADENPCDDLFEAYKDCIYKGMLNDRKKRGIKQASPESALGDYDED